MALSPNNFAASSSHSRIGSGPAASPGAPRIHTYRTQDAHAVVDLLGYFNAFAQHVQVGDLIYCAVVNGSGVLQTAGFHVVMTVSAAGVVDTSEVTVLTVTNTD